MKLIDVQQIGEELALKWDDGAESFLRLDLLRRLCPCAGCRGEVDVLGHLHRGPERPLPPSAFHLVRVEHVGGYAIRPIWADGHASGLYSYDYLRSAARA